MEEWLQTCVQIYNTGWFPEPEKCHQDCHMSTAQLLQDLYSLWFARNVPLLHVVMRVHGVQCACVCICVCVCVQLVVIIYRQYHSNSYTIKTLETTSELQCDIYRILIPLLLTSPLRPQFWAAGPWAPLVWSRVWAVSSLCRAQVGSGGCAA